MLAAAIDFWLLPSTLFFDTFFPPRKPVSVCIPVALPAETIPPAPVQSMQGKRKGIRSKRGDKPGAAQT
jgi:hypothetical protein